jgi:hypothetical protein
MDVYRQAADPIMPRLVPSWPLRNCGVIAQVQGILKIIQIIRTGYGKTRSGQHIVQKQQSALVRQTNQELLMIEIG